MQPVRNSFEKIKCLEENTTKAELTKKVWATALYVNRLINKKYIINKVIGIVEKLRYDVEMAYVKRNGD